MVILSSALALGVAEVVIRVAGVAGPSVAVSADERTFASQPGLYYPAPMGIDRRLHALPHRVTINNLGVRGPDLPRLKPVGQRRVLLIGDSFVFGAYVNDEETLPAQLERSLALECPGTRTLNFGVEGTSIDAARSMFERSLVLDPDVVILVFHDNDLSDLRPPTQWTKFAENRAKKSRPPISIVYGLVRRLALWTLLRNSIANLRARYTSAATPAPIAASSGAAASTGDRRDVRSRAARESWRVDYLEQLRALAARASRLGIPLMTTSFPSVQAFGDERATAIEWFAQVTSAEQIPYVDLLQALRRTGLGVDGLYLLPHDAHATARAYATAAERLKVALLEPATRSRACGRE